MKKKALIVLLLVPFVVGVLAFVTSSFVIRNVEQDVIDIDWDYENNTAFNLSEGKTLLNAEAVFDKDYPLAEGNTLMWESENEEVAKIIVEDGSYYLVPKIEGRSKITCFNEKKTVMKSFIAIIVGNSGAIVVNPIIPFSNKGISNVNYVGLYDTIENYNANIFDAYMDLDIEVIGGNLNKEEIQVSTTANVAYSSLNSRLTFKGDGEVTVKFNNPYSEVGDFELKFELVNAINVYDYDSLMTVTNKSNEGYPFVLRRNLESLKNSYEMSPDNKPLRLKNKDTELFGRLDKDGNISTFKDDIYSFETTYNHDFLNAWNTSVKNGHLPGHDLTTINCLSGVHIQKDVYGNGFVINTHELVYPSLEKEVNTPNGVIKVASLSKDDLFRGPLLYVSLGDPNFSNTEINPIFSLYGQDNSAFYIDGDNITLNDVHFKGADFGTNLTNLQYCGSVLDVYGNNNTIINSIIENGRNVIRSYSSDNLLVKNSLLRNGMEFLFKSGANEYNHVDLNKRVDYVSNGTNAVTNVKSYIAPNAFIKDDMISKDYKADGLLTFGIMHNTQISDFAGIEMLDYTKQDFIDGKNILIKALTNDKGMIDKDGNKNYKGNAILDKVFFHNSGISAISLDSYPQGSFIQNGITSLFKLIIGSYLDMFPENLCLTGYPTKVEIKNDTRFYDWKDLDMLTYESLLQQDIYTLIAVHGGIGSNFEITDDNYLPIKKILLDKQRNVLLKDNKINLPVYYQGGGYNISDVIFDKSYTNLLNETCEIDPYEYSLDLKQDLVPDFNTSSLAKLQAMKIAMLRAASNVMGFNPYKVIGLNNSESAWFNQSPSIEDLKL